MSTPPNNILAGLDIGANKIICMIAEVQDAGLAVLGIGVSPSAGLKDGQVRDIASLEAAIRTAVSKAERMARMTVAEVYVSVAVCAARSQIIEEDAPLDHGRAVSEQDVEDLLEKARARIAVKDGRTIVHALPAAYGLDGTYDRKPPIGLFGHTLSASLFVLEADEAPIRNLEMAVRRAQLDVAGFVYAPLASALAVLMDEEQTLGAAVVDMGAGGCGLSLFAVGAPIHSEWIKGGGQDVTDEISRLFLARQGTAENLKLRYGAALAETGDDNRQIEVSRIGDGSGEVLEYRSKLTQMMQRVYEQQLSKVVQQLQATGFTAYVGQRVVLTGGASQVERLTLLAEKVMGADIRLGDPKGITGLPENARGPAFATCVGILKFAHQYRQTAPRKSKRGRQSGGALSRLFEWARESF